MWHISFVFHSATAKLKSRFSWPHSRNTHKAALSEALLLGKWALAPRLVEQKYEERGWRGGTLWHQHVCAVALALHMDSTDSEIVPVPVALDQVREGELCSITCDRTTS